MDMVDLSDFEIAPETVEKLLVKDDPALELVDVREDWELLRGMLPNAVHIPLSLFAQHQDHWAANMKYVVYCEHGIRSLDVVVWLAEKKGIKAKSLQGGFSAWHGSIDKPPPDFGK